MTALIGLLGGFAEFGQTHNGVYRAADTALVFCDSPALVTTKHIIKAFQFFPDTLENLKEYLEKGSIERPFYASTVFLRNLVVLAEVAHHFNARDHDEGEFISDCASVMHIVVMLFVGFAAAQQWRSIQNHPPSSLKTVKTTHQMRECQLALTTAVTKIAQQIFLLFHTSYAGVSKLLTLIFNVCAIVSCVFSTNSFRNYSSPTQ